MLESENPAFEQKKLFEKSNARSMRTFGEKIRNVEQKDIESIETPTESILHVARHLKRLSSEIKEKLIGKKTSDGEKEIIIDESYLERQLKSTGSKFNEKLGNPEALIGFAKNILREKVEKSEEIPWFNNAKTGEKRSDLEIKITDDQKKILGLDPEDKLGTLSVIEITPEIEDKIKKEQRGKGELKDQIIVNTIENITPPETDNLIISIKTPPRQEKPVFYTMYTGILAPSLPRKEEQIEEEFEYNKKWWDKHAFVK